MSSSANATPAQVRIDAEKLTALIADVFVSLGVAAADARVVAEDLVLADLEGVGSHGVMLLPMYVERLRKGSISKASAGAIVVDNRTSLVLDAHHVLGQLTAHQAVDLVTSRAREYGMATVAVRNAFHFGTAGRYARLIADQGCVGIVMSNTRPLLPAPGGAEAITGNNPIAVAVPSSGTQPAKVDMALSATAMGKIRLAAAAGKPIPADWAMAPDGSPTTDPNEAIKGMLAPAAGPKGFGLAFVIDLLCGGLSEGAIGAEVRPLYGDASQPYRCSQLFLAIDVKGFTDPKAFAERVDEQVQRVRRSKRAPGVERVYAPGELSQARYESSAGTVTLSHQTFESFVTTAKSAGVQVDTIL